MAGAYATFANDGVFNRPYFVDRIEDAQGNVIWTHELQPTRVMSAQAARLVNQVLQANVEGGTGTGARLAGGRPAAGKTGTSDGPNDLWFDGYTPQLSTAVWIGSTGDPFVVYPGSSGGVYAAPSWRVFMDSVLVNQPAIPFVAPAPTRGGIGISIGDGDGMTFVDRYGAKALETPPGPQGAAGPSPAAPPNTPPTSTPPSTTSNAPPVTAYGP